MCIKNSRPITYKKGFGYAIKRNSDDGIFTDNTVYSMVSSYEQLMNTWLTCTDRDGFHIFTNKKFAIKAFLFVRKWSDNYLKHLILVRLKYQEGMLTGKTESMAEANNIPCSTVMKIKILNQIPVSIK